MSQASLTLRGAGLGLMATANLFFVAVGALVIGLRGSFLLRGAGG